MAVKGLSLLRRDHPVRLWSGFFLPPLAWFAYEIGLSAVVRTGCVRGGPPLGPLAGVAALLVCVAAVWLATPQARGAAVLPDERPRRFIARLVIGGAALFGLAISFQLVATLLVPPCAR